MIHTKRSLFLNALRIIALCLVCFIFLAPFYVAIIYAFKSKEQIAKTGLAFLDEIYLGNFMKAMQLPNYFNTMKNSLIVAVCVVALLVIVCSMGAYIITRRNSRFYNIVFYIFQLAVLLPFQVIMYPLYMQIRDIGALNHLWGLVLVQCGVFMGFYVFLYAGFIKSVPIALEEAATIDGCNRYKIFGYIVFPLLKPINMTIVVLSFLASWNDFIISMIITQKNLVRTLPMVQFYFFGEYSSNVNVAFAAAILSMLPVVVVYFCAQKYIVSGVTAGAIKT